jgi:hypothetical protein
MCKHALGHGSGSALAVSLYCYLDRGAYLLDRGVYLLDRGAYLLVGGLVTKEFSRKLGTWKDQLSSYGHKVLKIARPVQS